MHVSFVYAFFFYYSLHQSYFSRSRYIPGNVLRTPACPAPYSRTFGIATVPFKDTLYSKSYVGVGLGGDYVWVAFEHFSFV